MTDTTTVTQDEYYARVPKAVVYHPDLSGNDVRVYATLSERAGKKRESWPGVRRISKDIGMSPTTVQSALDRLEDLKLVVVERSKGMVNHYHLPILGVSDFGTPPYQDLEQTVSDSGTELDQRTRPRKAAGNFDDFHKHRALAEATRQQNAGTKVRSLRGLAKSIAERDDFLAESKHVWAHRDCSNCGGTGTTTLYPQAGGSVDVPCDAGGVE